MTQINFELTSNYLIVNSELFTNIKKLKCLNVKGYLLIDFLYYDMSYLTEASFRFQLPVNISSFINLKKLCLELFDQMISLNGQFLEDLVNLEDLELAYV